VQRGVGALLLGIRINAEVIFMGLTTFRNFRLCMEKMGFSVIQCNGAFYVKNTPYLQTQRLCESNIQTLK